MADTDKPEKSLFERNHEAIERAERADRVRDTRNDLGRQPGERTGVGGGRGGGNEPGGANDRAINERNQ